MVKVLSTFIFLSFIFHHGSLRRAIGGERYIMTNEILEHLNDVLAELKRLSEEIDASVNDETLHESIATELEDSVYEPLLNLIDSLDDIILSTSKLDDVDYYNDPYKEGYDD